MIFFSGRRLSGEHPLFYFSLTLGCCILVLFTNCKKSAHASGTVTEFGTGVPVEGITVEVDEDDKGTYRGAYTLYVAGAKTWRQQTDREGHFNVAYKARTKKHYAYFTSINPDEYDTIATFLTAYVPWPSLQQSDAMAERGASNLSFTVMKAARLILIFTKVNPENVGRTSFIYSFSDGATGLGGSVGNPVNVASRLVPCGNGTASVQFDVVKNGVRTSQIDTIDVKPFSLIRHRFFY